MRFAHREFVTPGMLMLVAGISSGMILLFAFIGPFGTKYTLSWNGRLAFCLVTGVLCLLICYPAVALTLFLTRFRTNAQIALALATYAIIMAIPCGAITYGVYGVLHGVPLPSAKVPETYLACAGCILAATALVHYVLHLRVIRHQLLAGKARTAEADTVRCAKDAAPVRASQAEPNVTASRGPAVPGRTPRDGNPAAGRAGPPSGSAVGQGSHSAPVDETDPSEEESPPHSAGMPSSSSFLSRLPTQLGRDVVYLKVSGHYLEVVTTHGSSVILQRLMDAVRELGSRGMQTHRSYWVAHRHVRYVVRRERRTLLHLTGDHEIPVSRTFLAEVRLHMKNTPPRSPLQRRALPPTDGQDR